MVFVIVVGYDGKIDVPGAPGGDECLGECIEPDGLAGQRLGDGGRRVAVGFAEEVTGGDGTSAGSHIDQVIEGWQKFG